MSVLQEGSGWEKHTGLSPNSGAVQIFVISVSETRDWKGKSKCLFIRPNILIITNENLYQGLIIIHPIPHHGCGNKFAWCRTMTLHYLFFCMAWPLRIFNYPKKQEKVNMYVYIYNHPSTHLITLVCTMIYVYKMTYVYRYTSCMYIHIHIYRIAYLFSVNTTFHHLLNLCFHFQMGFPRTSMAGIRNAKVFPVPVCLKNPWRPTFNPQDWNGAKKRCKQQVIEE